MFVGDRTGFFLLLIGITSKQYVPNTLIAIRMIFHVVQ